MNNKVTKHGNDFTVHGKEARLESLIRTQGAYLMTLGKMINDGRPLKELKQFVNKYGIGK
jgi:hypothetical protein